LFFLASSSHVYIHHIFGDLLVPASFVLVFDDENHIETGENGGLKIDVFAGCLEIVISPKNGVGGCKNGCPGVQDGGNSCFGDGDGLLFHGFMDSHSVLVAHLIKLVNADYTPVGQDHSSSF
jgi:hypothetical protein